MTVFGGYEKRHHRLAPLRVFYRRLAANAGFALALIALSLAGGMAGYAFFEGLGIIDAFLNAAMILSGMGPVAQMQTSGGKIFAGLYAIYSGVLIIATTGVILAPLVHRMLHRFHLQDDESPGGGAKNRDAELTPLERREHLTHARPLSRGRNLIIRRENSNRRSPMTEAPIESAARTEAAALIRDYYAAFNRGDTDTMLKYVTEDVIHDINQGERRQGKDKFREFNAHMTKCYKEELKDIVVMISKDAARASAEFVVHGDLQDHGRGPSTRQADRSTCSPLARSSPSATAKLPASRPTTIWKTGRRRFSAERSTRAGHERAMA